MSSNGVVLISDAHAFEASEFRLNRLIEWAGFAREQFEIVTVADWGGDWKHRLPSAPVMVPMGPPATAGFTSQPLTNIRGYVCPGEGYHVIPTVHPAFIQRGQSRWSAAFINDLQKAVRLAQTGLAPVLLDYLLDPSPLDAYRWAQEFVRKSQVDPGTRLAFDIETPGKGDDEEAADTDADAPDRTWHIDRIGFSDGPHRALSIPWEPPYAAAIRLLLASPADKVVWNAGFDVPRVRRSGMAVGGTIHDGMVAWHILHTDLPKRLGFVATFTCPWQPAWKHLSGSKPAFYNATDADVEWRAMESIEAELRRSGLWDVYVRDVVDLEPLLVFMHDQGMPLDPVVRLDRAVRLAADQATVMAAMESHVPTAARRIDHVFVRPPADLTGLLSRDGSRLVRRCAHCGCERPRKDHFKRFVKKHNPCADAGVREAAESVTEYYRLCAFKPSREQLIAYHTHLKRALPTAWDQKTRTRKVSFGEKVIKELAVKYHDDPLYLQILQYRTLSKVAGCYIGYPAEEAA